MTTLAIVLCVIAVVAAYSVRTGNAPMPTSARVKATLLQAIPTDLDGTIYELGAGWGTLAIPLARRFPGCPVIAYELSPLPWLVSTLRAIAERLPNLVLRRADFHQARIADAALVVCYLYPGAMDKLKRKFEAELKPGALVVSNFFAVPGWRPERVLTVDDLYNSRIYLYRVPAVE